ncbi:MAG: type I-U CRISPR-associated RAMP protein Csb1/Cas7u [Myxococcota bacterium]
MKTLTYEDLEKAFSEGAAALRVRTRLHPAGGPNDKVFPPTFGDTVTVRDTDGREHRTRYAAEWRRVDGEDRLCVLLDSVASQANRFEEALLHAYDQGELPIPMVRVDFTQEHHEDVELDLSTLGGDGYLTTLEAPHRLADALLRDSMLGDLRFRASEPGRAFSAADPHSAGAVFQLCPQALVFGMWDSTGPQGGLGSKFQRALSSEIVGINVQFGRKTASRLDPAGIEKQAGPVFEAKDPERVWTVNPDEAAMEKKKPKPFGGSGQTGGKPSSINHGNVTPSVDSEAGGVTLDYAEQTTVVSLPALRRLRFPKRLDGTLIPTEQRGEATRTAHVALASLAVTAIAMQRHEGYDLRSRCLFIPDGPLAIEIVGADGTASEPMTLDAAAGLALTRQAADRTSAAGLPWNPTPVDLRPAPKLVDLIRRSRQQAAQGELAQDD